MKFINPKEDNTEKPEKNKTECNSRKVVIVGAGDVGASFAYALLQSGTAER